MLDIDHDHGCSPTRAKLASYCEDLLFLAEEDYDTAIIGLVELPTGFEVVAYSRNRVIEVLESNGMSHEEANEYFEFNIAGAHMGDLTPVLIDERFAE